MNTPLKKPKDFLKPLTLGTLSLPINIAYAPLAGCSDYPFRKMSNIYRPALFFCEMVKIDALVRNDKNTFRMLDYSHDMHPLGAQLCGSNPKIVGKAAKIIEELGFDVVDLNCGCPVDKVTKDGSGSGLLKTLPLIGELLSNIKAAVKIPITVKIRVGWDAEHIVADQVTRIAEEAGASAIFIHGRTREQAYRGEVDYSPIRQAVQAKKNILVFGNGDIFDSESAYRMFTETGADGILVARGTMGAPWIYEHIFRSFQEETTPPLDPLLLRETFLTHLSFIKEYQNKERAQIDLRKIGSWYLRDKPETKSLREQLGRLRSLEEMEELLHASLCL
ncbi:MAG: tRNA dihydrouridine synthase DusB [Verrucomicrobia bacterium]|nr:tRNA dihydrouridine synthase DusB [Verrucomicrobiota bacterium]